MSEPMTRRHGLEAFLSLLPTRTGDEDSVKIEIQADLGHINLRGSPVNPEFLSTVAGVLRQELPVAANTMTTGNLRIYWLGPDEWQVVTGNDDTDELSARLRAALEGLHASVSDLTGGQVALHVSGPDVRDVLAKGCTLDLSPAEFEVGACAQSGLAKTSMLIGRIDDAEPKFEIVVRRSFADYALRWLHHAASEYEVRFSATR